MTRSKLLPPRHEYLTSSLVDLHLLRWRLLWKCESKQWHFILKNILSNPHKMFTVNMQLSFIVCCFKQSFVSEYRAWQLGLCEMAEESVMWSSLVFFSLYKTGDVRVASRGQESVSVASIVKEMYQWRSTVKEMYQRRAKHSASCVSYRDTARHSQTRAE